MRKQHFFRRSALSAFRALSIALSICVQIAFCGAPLPWKHHKHIESPSSGEGGSVPHVIHQSWKSEMLPQHFHAWQASWKKSHPSWEYRFWTDKDNNELVEESYPWFLKVFHSLTPIEKADASRCLYMHHYGGVYADLDFQSLRPLDDILQGKKVAMGKMQDDVDEWQHALPNAFMASVPGHDFWLFVMQIITERTATEEMRKEEGLVSQHPWPEERTGPAAVWHAYQEYKRQLPGNSDVFLFEKEAIYPLDWRRFPKGVDPEYVDGQGRDFRICNVVEPQYDQQACLEAYPNTYALTFWSHTWGRRR